MKESLGSSQKEQGSVDLKAQFDALSDQGRQLVASYIDIFSSYSNLLKAKLKANLKLLVTIFSLIVAAVMLMMMVWASLQVVLAYALVSTGFSWYASAGLVMALNVALVYYLTATAVRLFDKASGDLLDDFFNADSK
ncbi:MULTISPECIES: hypothetical protein [Pseudoalteromonas]|uniref:Uncharacterized protein n=1 Tax=Pseudoalteromonas amylolytica TaxID=1859457 RepID=A0A1S1MQT7_9GAMM|nr:MULTISPECIES: hypothetical protein [Pseudoalteromonas]MCF6436289.1 hypothetical protein [Pseudoalteromonas sp. MMG022]OHU86786.1 hypothetical protein BFC16_14925 [Pseudoalteromonas sp. JW3]OHU88689.1 hypothetical protein BET10_17830 [Pseudoalteromonas amylolytica]